MRKEEIAHNECFFRLGEPSAIFGKFEIVVCKLFEFGSQNFVVWKRVNDSETEAQRKSY